MQLIQLNEKQICDLYESALRRDFPPSELKSLSAILNMFSRGMYDVLGAYEGDVLVAYALLYKPSGGRMLLLDYLAVLPQYRGRRIGTRLLTYLRSYYASSADVLMIECERPKAAPDEQEARKRIRFYTFAGARLTSVRIWLFDVEYSILVLPCTTQIPELDWAQQMLSIYQQMLPQELYERNVRLLQR